MELLVYLYELYKLLPSLVYRYVLELKRFKTLVLNPKADGGGSGEIFGKNGLAFASFLFKLSALRNGLFPRVGLSLLDFLVDVAQVDDFKQVISLPLV